MDQLNHMLERNPMRNQLVMDHLNSTHRLLAREIIQLLEHGLKERITLLCPLPAVDQTDISVRRRSTVDCFDSSSYSLCQWSIDEAAPARTSLALGVHFSDQYDLTVLKGPENGTPEVSLFLPEICHHSSILLQFPLIQAEAFRKLWSERCELRRFPDGSILESVVWNVDCAKDKRLVWMDTARFLLEL